MRPHFFLLLFLLILSPATQAKAVEPEFPLTEDSKPQADVPKGEMIKDTYTTEGHIFPGTQREYQLYIPHGLDRSKPAAFMVFQDGVIYQAPAVFDNLIAKKDIPPLIGVFIKPGVVPAANENALPRFNRSYEYDSITDNYARFLIDEFLPVIEKKHGIKLSTDPNDAAVSGNSSGGIAAFMVAWHRPDRFRRVFTGVGTYVGIHGGDRLPVLVRKLEPKPIRIFLQSGTGDNNLYCGDWWMANQMMERSFTWAGYDVNHAWGEGGHNQKHASQIFPDVLRWLWRDWQTNKEIKANAKGESKWKGYEVVRTDTPWKDLGLSDLNCQTLAPNRNGDVYFVGSHQAGVHFIESETGAVRVFKELTEPLAGRGFGPMAFAQDGRLYTGFTNVLQGFGEKDEIRRVILENVDPSGLCFSFGGRAYVAGIGAAWFDLNTDVKSIEAHEIAAPSEVSLGLGGVSRLCLSPDQTVLYASDLFNEPGYVYSWKLGRDGSASNGQAFFKLEPPPTGIAESGGICVDAEGRLYVATKLGIQVCDQAGRVNFIIPTPEPPHDVCFGGKDLSELFIACGDKIYKRPMKVCGVVSGQMPPIKPAAPKL
jgi:enterochelin esterase-like enzyme